METLDNRKMLHDLSVLQDSKNLSKQQWKLLKHMHAICLNFPSFFNLLSSTQSCSIRKIHTTFTRDCYFRCIPDNICERDQKLQIVQNARIVQLASKRKKTRAARERFSFRAGNIREVFKGDTRLSPGFSLPSNFTKNSSHGITVFPNTFFRNLAAYTQNLLVQNFIKKHWIFVQKRHFRQLLPFFAFAPNSPRFPKFDFLNKKF